MQDLPSLPLPAGAAATLAQRRAAAPLKPRKPQEACDIGLFGDSAAQIDLIDLSRKEPK